MSDTTQPEPAVEPVEPIVYHFDPANPGESLVSYGVPARDLTKTDWDRLTPEAQQAATDRGPSGHPMYSKLSRTERKAAKDAAEAAERKAAHEAAHAAKAAAGSTGTPNAGGPKE